MSIKNYIHNIRFSGSDNTLLDCPDVSYKYNADTCLLYTSPSPRD